MKRFVLQINGWMIKACLLLLTFLIGISSAALVRQKSAPKLSVEDLPPKVTLCQLAQNPVNYNGKIIQVEGDVEDLDGLIHISDEGCQMVNVLWEQDKTHAQPEELFKELVSGKFRARVVVTGEFDSEGTQGCFGTKFAVRATTIKLQDFSRRGQAQ